MEWSDMTTNPLKLLFLDWKQAFDSLDHNAMLIALERFGLSPRAIRLISSFYKGATFYTTNPLGEDSRGQVGSGIRQGCPLSPYLFIMVLTVILEDADTMLLAKGIPTNTWSVARPTHDIEYADDTLLMALTTTQLQNILHALESQADLCGMKLNRTKTELLTDPRYSTPRIYFINGQEVPTTTQVKYLGSLIAWKDPFSVAFKHRAAFAESAYKKLRLVWNSHLTRRTKLRIFQATFVPVLTYGLDALTLTDKHLDRIDAFFFRFLRRIVGIKASFYSRVSNNVVWRTANYSKRPSERMHKMQYKMLKEVFFADLDNPLHNVVFASAFRDRIRVTGRKRGRKKAYWVETTTLRFFKDRRNLARVEVGPHCPYSSIYRDLASSEQAPMRAPHRLRARRQQKIGVKCLGA